MKQKPTIFTLLLLGAAILTFAQDPFEPNDTYQDAATVTCGQQFSAYIQVTGDVDWYEIQMAESGVLKVAVTSVNSNLDLDVGIYQVIDNVLTLIADDRVYNASTGQDMFSNAVGEAGSYLIKINDESNNGFSDADPYDVQLTCNPNTLELNQVYEEASPIPIDTCFDDNIYGDNHTYDEFNDVDWFAVQAPATGIIEVAVTSVPNDVDLNVGIYQVIDNVLTLIADDRTYNASGGANLFSQAAVAPGTFLIVVEDESDDDYSEDTYNFCVNFTPNALELNQIYEEASPIPIDTCFDDNIYGDNHTYDVFNDVDWFEVQAPSTGIIEVAVTSVPNDVDLNVEIYQVIDNVLTLIADDRTYNASGGANMFAQAAVAPGTFLIVVEDESDDDYNEDAYNFCVNFTPNALELNQIYEEASVIPFDTCFEDNIYGDNHTYDVFNDVDWFKVEIAQTIDIDISVTSVPGNIDLNVAIYELVQNVLTQVADDGVYNANGGQDMFVEAELVPGAYYVVVEDESDDDYNEETYTFCIEMAIGVRENNPAGQIQTYPNPNYGSFYVDLDSYDNHSISEISIYNKTGMKIANFQPDTEAAGPITIEIPDASPGIYLLKAHTDEGLFTKKIIVQ